MLAALARRSRVGVGAAVLGKELAAGVVAGAGDVVGAGRGAGVLSAVGRVVGAVGAWIDRQEEDEVRGLLDDLGVTEAQNAVTASRKRPGDTLGSGEPGPWTTPATGTAKSGGSPCGVGGMQNPRGCAACRPPISRRGSGKTIFRDRSRRP